MRDAPVEPGEILAGKYRVERVLGVGAMGVVVAAVHLTLDQPVALKFMQRRDEPDKEERFLREARVAAMLRSPHVVRVLDVGSLDSGAPYLVMDLLEGQDLARVLKMRGVLPIGEAVEYVLQACDAIAEAHAAGIVHRDLKPANLFLVRGPNGGPMVKVLDFGISKLMSSNLELTATGDNIGTPLYMSPEQMRSPRDVDVRADIWSLGVILYELITGKTPFHAENYMALCHRLLNDEPTPIDQLRAGVPPALAAAILRCVERPPDRRWPDVASFAEEIAPHATPMQSTRGILGSRSLPSLPPVAPPPAPLPSVAPPSAGPPALAASTSSPGKARSRAALWVGGAAVLGLGTLATLAAFTRAAPLPPRPAATASEAPPVAPPPSAAPPPALTTSAASAEVVPSATASVSAAPEKPLLRPVSSARKSSAKPAASVDYDQR